MSATSGVNSSSSRMADGPSCATRRVCPRRDSRIRERVSRVLVVVDDQNAAAVSGRGHQGHLPLGARGRCRLGRAQRHAEHELAALLRTVAPRLDRSTVQLDQATGDRESQAEAALRPIEGLALLGEHVEHKRQHLGRDADARVRDGDADVLSLAPGLDLDPPALLGVLPRVGQEIGHDLSEPRRIGGDHEACGRHVRDQLLVAKLEERARHLDRLGDDVTDLDGLGPELDLAARDARDIEQIVDQPDQVSGLALDDRPLFLEHRFAAQAHELQRGQHRRQGIAKLVSQHRQELVLRAIGARRLVGECLQPAARQLQLQPRRHLRQQLAGRERLHQIIVGAGPDPLDP